MPSPVSPSDFCDLAPTPTTPPCDAVKTIFFDLPAQLCKFFNWMLKPDGTLTDEFKRTLNAVPAGIVHWFGGLTVPDGYLFCNGGAYKQTEYQHLFNAIGTRFGAGNNIDEFQVPNMGGRVIVGVSPVAGYPLAETGGSNEFTLTEDQIPPLWYAIEATGEVGPGAPTTGFIRVGAGETIRFQQTVTSAYAHTYDGNTDGSDPRPITPVSIMVPFIVMTPCIKT